MQTDFLCAIEHLMMCLLMLKQCSLISIHHCFNQCAYSYSSEVVEVQCKDFPYLPYSPSCSGTWDSYCTLIIMSPLLSMLCSHNGENTRMHNSIMGDDIEWHRQQTGTVVQTKKEDRQWIESIIKCIRHHWQMAKQ